MADDNSNAGAGKDVESAGKKLPYPKAVFFILTNEFCERFSYYGMRAILILYLKNVLLFNEDDATVIYHTFTMLCYFTPLFGSIVADSFLGKFRTIFYLSIVYAAGNIILSLSAIGPLNLPQVPISMIGLALIALGTGGIKPCVSSFGGDQFKLPEQESQLASFFSVFYFSINAGSLISTFVTPIFRKDVKCFDQDDCYPLAFGVPAILMVTSLVVFLIGRIMYVIRKPTGNVVLAVVKTISHALSVKRKSKEKKEHWMDYAEDKYSKRDIGDIKIVLRVLFLYIPLPLFWALFDQQGSRWTFQASRMNGDVGSFVFKPDQMQVVNPLLVLAFIPIFDQGIYPLLAKCNLLKKPLQRLTVGGIFAGISFMVSGFVEVELQKTYPIELGAGQSFMSVINHSPLNVTGFICNGTTQIQNFTMDANSGIGLEVLPAGEYDIRLLEAAIARAPCDGTGPGKRFNATKGEASSILLVKNTAGWDFVIPQNITEIKPDDDDEKSIYDSLEKSEEGNPFVRFIQYGVWDDIDNDFTSGNHELNKNTSILVARNQTDEEISKNGIRVAEILAYNATEFYYPDWRTTPTLEIEPQKYRIHIRKGGVDIPVSGSYELKLGGSYIISLVKEENGAYTSQMHTITQPNSLHMFWLLPQYIIMTLGEIMFSITIMDFSYSQAPVSMKSVMQSAWLMTVAFGNLIDVIIAGAKLFDKQYKEFFLFAGLMYLDMIIFSYMAYKYVPADHSVEAKEDEDEKDENNDDKEK